MKWHAAVPLIGLVFPRGSSHPAISAARVPTERIFDAIAWNRVEGKGRVGLVKIGYARPIGELVLLAVPGIPSRLPFICGFLCTATMLRNNTPNPSRGWSNDQ